MISIPNSEPYGSTRACNVVNKCSKFLLKGEYVEYIITRKVSKSVKVSVQANQSSMSVGYFFHSWYFFITGGNHVIFIIQKCHLSPNYPCMKQCYRSHKGMGIGISYVVIHVLVYKKFFQVLLQRSSVCHPVVPSENPLPLHLTCLNILECCLVSI